MLEYLEIINNIGIANQTSLRIKYELSYIRKEVAGGFPSSSRALRATKLNETQKPCLYETLNKI